MDKEQCFARFKETIVYLKNRGRIHKQQDIADAMGISKSYMSDVKNDRDNKFSEDFLRRYAKTFSDYINEEWLVDGIGRMENVSRTMRPHYEATASAGFMDGMSDGGMSTQFRQMVAGVSDYDFTVKVKGDSMLPRIEEDDVLMCHKLNDRLNPPLGKICVLDTKEGMVVKVIKEIGEDSIIVHSLNPDYKDYAIENTSILNVARVVASIREY